MFTSDIENVIINEHSENIQENEVILDETYHYIIPKSCKQTVIKPVEYLTEKQNDISSNSFAFNTSCIADVNEVTEKFVEDDNIIEVNEFLTLQDNTDLILNKNAHTRETSFISRNTECSLVNNKSNCAYDLSNIGEKYNFTSVRKIKSLYITNETSDTISSSASERSCRNLKDTTDTLNHCPGKSRYGRTRKPKVSCDFISIDKQKDFNNCIESDDSSLEGKMRRRKGKRNFSYPFIDEGFKKIKFENEFLKYDDDDKNEYDAKVNEILHWDLGDVAWAKRGFKPYWPCVISVDPDSSNYEIDVEKSNQRICRKYHVNFIKDNGRHAWLLSSNLMPFRNKQQFFDCKEAVKNNKCKLKNFTLTSANQNCWHVAVEEAEVLLTLPIDERIKLYTDDLDMLPFLKSHCFQGRNRFSENSFSKRELEQRNSYGKSANDISFTFTDNLPTAVTSKGLRFIPRRNSINLPLSTHGIENITIHRSSLDVLCDNDTKHISTTTEILSLPPQPSSPPPPSPPRKTVRFLRVRNLHENHGINRPSLNSNHKNNTSNSTVKRKIRSSSNNNVRKSASIVNRNRAVSNKTNEIIISPSSEKKRSPVINEFKNKKIGKYSNAIYKKEIKSKLIDKLIPVVGRRRGRRRKKTKRHKSNAINNEQRETNNDDATEQIVVIDSNLFVNETKNDYFDEVQTSENAIKTEPPNDDHHVDNDNIIEVTSVKIEEIISTPRSDGDSSCLNKKVNNIRKSARFLCKTTKLIDNNRKSRNNTNSSSTSDMNRNNNNNNNNDKGIRIKVLRKNIRAKSKIDSRNIDKSNKMTNNRKRTIIRLSSRKRVISNAKILKLKRKLTKSITKRNDNYKTKANTKGKKSKVNSSSSTEKAKRKVDPGFEIFSLKCYRQISSKHPRMNSASISNLVRKKWLKLSRSQKYRYKRIFKEQNQSEDESVRDITSGDCSVINKKVKIEEDNQKVSSISNSSSSNNNSSRLKKGGCLFAGLKCEKICQLCEKAGSTVRCQGPCNGYYHLSCAQSQDINIMKNNQPSPRRGSRKIVTPARYASCDRLGSVRRNIVRMIDTDVDNANSNNDVDDNANIGNDNTDEVDNETVTRRSRKFRNQYKKTIKKEKKTIVDCNNELEIKVEQQEEYADPIESSYNAEKMIRTANQEIKSERNESVNCTITTTIATNPMESNDSVLDEQLQNREDVSTISQDESDRTNELKEINDTVTITATVECSENGFKCKMCANARIQPCFICGYEMDPKTESYERIRCQIASCGRVYHKDCLRDWPQTIWSTGKVRAQACSKEKTLNTTTILTCPHHNCHICISDNPVVLKTRINNDRLIRCIKCPTSYHRKMHCIPAGSKLLTTSHMICPRHYKPSKSCKTYHFNTLWCFICAKGGSLICCDLCPTSFHVDCLKLRKEEYEGSYICEDCQTGRFPLYGEIVWVKLGHYRWWPARILFPFEIPENILNIPHDVGEFVVFFFGSKDHYWVNRGRVFLYQEGDSGKSSYRKNAVDLTFERAVQEAQESFVRLKSEKSAREVELKTDTKPPRYAKIKTNKPVGNVRIVEENRANIPACDCNPQSKNPCGPGSDCINRMLMIECNPSICPAGKRCNNQYFEKRLYPPLVPYRTENRGWGLKTLVLIKKGDFVIEYVGEMIDEEEYRKRVTRMHRAREDNYYFLTIDKDRMLDAGPKGNVSRFMNHSCDPNCETQKWTVNGDTRVGLFALQDIPANTELVFNYHLDSGGAEKKPCNCGTTVCSGFIGVKVNNKILKQKSDKSSSPKSRLKKRKLHVKRNRAGKIVIPRKNNNNNNNNSRNSVKKKKCFFCNKSGKTLVTCNLKSCSNTYHMPCIRKETHLPGNRSVCSWHFCNVCKSKRKVSKCSYCLDAFCAEHIQDNIVLNSVTGNMCKKHPSPSNFNTASNTTAKVVAKRRSGKRSANVVKKIKQVRKFIPLSIRKQHLKQNKIRAKLSTNTTTSNNNISNNIKTKKIPPIIIKKSSMSNRTRKSSLLPFSTKMIKIGFNNRGKSIDSVILNTSMRYDEASLSNLRTYSKVHAKQTSPLSSPEKDSNTSTIINMDNTVDDNNSNSSNISNNNNNDASSSSIIQIKQSSTDDEIKIIDTEADANDYYVINELQNDDAIIYKNTIDVVDVNVINPDYTDENGFNGIFGRPKKYFVDESLNLDKVTKTLLSLPDKKNKSTIKNRTAKSKRRLSSLLCLSRNSIANRKAAAESSIIIQKQQINAELESLTKMIDIDTVDNTTMISNNNAEIIALETNKVTEMSNNETINSNNNNNNNDNNAIVITSNHHNETVNDNSQITDNNETNLIPSSSDTTTDVKKISDNNINNNEDDTKINKNIDSTIVGSKVTETLEDNTIFIPEINVILNNNNNSSVNEDVSDENPDNISPNVSGISSNDDNATISVSGISSNDNNNDTIITPNVSGISSNDGDNSKISLNVSGISSNDDYDDIDDNSTTINRNLSGKQNGVINQFPIISPLNKAAVAIANFRNKKLSSDDLPLSRTKSLKHNREPKITEVPKTRSYLLSPLKSPKSILNSDINNRIETSYLLLSRVQSSDNTIPNCGNTDVNNTPKKH